MKHCFRMFLLLLAVAAPAQPAAAGDYVFAVTTDYETSGSSTKIEIDSPWGATSDLEPVGSDPVVRQYRNKIYVVNRLYADNIQVLDPALGYDTILEFSVGAGSNPQDIVFVNEERAYVSRYESNWLYEVNPSTGAILDSIDLSVFSDADGLPEMSQMIVSGDTLFVQIQRIDRSLWLPAPPSCLAVIDIRSNTVIDVDAGTPGVQGIELTGLNPNGPMHCDRAEGRIYVAETGEYLASDGGIESVHMATLSAEGYVVTEGDLGGDVGIFGLGSERGFVIVSDDWFWTVRLVSFSRSTGSVLDTLYSTDGYVPDMEVDTSSAQIFLCDRKVSAPGVHVFHTLTGAKMNASPIGTGILPPADLVIVKPIIAGVAESESARSGRLSWAAPNPFRGETSIWLAGDAGAPADVSIYTIHGRLVRELSAGPAEGAFAAARWDGRDESGRIAPPGVYLYRASGGREPTTGRIVRLR